MNEPNLPSSAEWHRCEECGEPFREGEDVAFRATNVMESSVTMAPVHLGCASKNRYEPPDAAA